MHYFFIGTTILFLYLYIESKMNHSIQINMIRLINQTSSLYNRYQYYEKRQYVVSTLLKESAWYIRIWYSEYTLNQMYKRILLLYPTQPFVL